MGNLNKIVETKTFTVSVLALIMLFGFFLRFNDLGHWLDNKDQYFFDSGSRPVPLGVDSYYYMDIANDLLHLSLKKFDEYRQAPTGFTRPSSAPLLSVFIAFFTFLSNKPLEWIAILMPPFLGVLLAIPTYLLGYLLVISAKLPWDKNYVANVTTAKIVGFCAALFSLLTNSYIVRSSIGWCDTDILNVTFIALLTLIAAKIANTEETNKRYRLFAFFAIFLLMFVWWWDQGLAPPLMVAVALLLVLSFVIPKKSKKRILVGISLFSFFLIIIWMLKGNVFLLITKSIFRIFSYVLVEEKTTIFPVLGRAAEQSDYTFTQLSLSVAGNIYVYSLSLLGLGVLACFSRKNFLFLVPLLGLNVLAFNASRFSIFVAPLYGLGLGAIIFLSLSTLKIHQAFIKSILIVIFVIICSFYPVRTDLTSPQRTPILDPVLSEAMINIAKTTPNDAVIWASWDRGHPLVYYSKRKTLADGIFHPAWLTYILNFPMGVNDLSLAANWIQFYTVNGYQGISKIFSELTGDRQNWEEGVPRLSELLKAGVVKSRTILKDKYKFNTTKIEELLQLLFPNNCPPVYLFMDYKFFDEPWYQIAKWDFKNKTGPSGYTKVALLSYYIDKSMVRGESAKGPYSVNLNTGWMLIEGTGYFDITDFYYDYGDKTYSKIYPQRGSIGHTIHLRQNEKHRIRYGAFFDNKLNDTVLISLYFRKEFSKGYFTPVLNETPAYLLCEVKGEKYQPHS